MISDKYKGNLSYAGMSIPIVVMGVLYSFEDFLSIFMCDKSANCFTIELVEEDDEKYIRCIAKSL